MSLQVRYRPSTLKNFAGNEDLKKAIQQVLDRGKPPSAFLIIGPSGCGKTTLGRIIARGLGCAKSAFKEQNTANDRTLPSIRKMIDQLQYSPLKGNKKVVLLDEAHQLQKAPQEALLKVLEEPPPHVHLIVCTTNPEALKDTFKRRCHIYEVNLLTSKELTILMRRILKSEGVQNFPEEIIDRVIEVSGGSAGIALKTLDQVIDMGDDIKGALKTLKSSGTAESEIIDICRALINFNMSDSARWNRVRKLLSRMHNIDGESARRPILAYLSKVLIGNKLDGNNDAVALIMEEFSKNYYDSGAAGLYVSCYKACNLEEGEE